MIITESIAKQLANSGKVFFLCNFTANNFELYLTTNEETIIFDNKQYKPCVNSKELNFNNLSKVQDLSLQIPSKINNNIIEIEFLLKAKVDILIVFQDEKSQLFGYKIFNGFVSTISKDNQLLTITISPIIAKLNKSINDFFSPLCRACFRDKNCSINVEQYMSTGVISQIISQDCVIGNHQENKATQIGYYKYGVIKFLTGKLAGISLQIKDEDNGKIFLLKNTRLITIGDKYNIHAGCDKSFNTCKNKFNNAINFMGEPFIE